MLLRSILESAEEPLIEDPVFRDDLVQALAEQVALLERPGMGQIGRPTGKPPSTPPPKPAPPKKPAGAAPPAPQGGFKRPKPAPAAKPAPPPAPAAEPPGEAPAPAAKPKKKPPVTKPTPAAPAPPAQQAPQSVKRCPVGSRKDRQTGQCRELTPQERNGLQSHSFHRSATYHQNLVKDGGKGLHPHHRAALVHQGNAHAALGLHHAHMQRAQRARDDVTRHYHMSKAQDYMGQAQTHLKRRNSMMNKMGEPSLGRRLINRIGSLFSRSPKSADRNPA